MLAKQGKKIFQVNYTLCTVFDNVDPTPGRITDGDGRWGVVDGVPFVLTLNYTTLYTIFYYTMYYVFEILNEKSKH